MPTVLPEPRLPDSRILLLFPRLLLRLLFRLLPRLLFRRLLRPRSLLLTRPSSLLFTRPNSLLFTRPSSLLLLLLLLRLPFRISSSRASASATALWSGIPSSTSGKRSKSASLTCGSVALPSGERRPKLATGVALSWRAMRPSASLGLALHIQQQPFTVRISRAPFLAVVPTVKHGTTRHRGYPFLQLDLWAFCLAERTIHHRYSGVRQCNVAAMLGARSYGDQRRSGVNAAEKGPRWRVSVRMVGAGGGRMASGGVVWLPKPGRAGPLNMPVVLSSARCQRSAAHIHLGRHKRKEHPVHTLENITGLFIHFGDTHSSITITVLMWENVKIPSSIHSGKTKAAKRFYGIKNHFIHRWHTNSSNVRMASSGTASIHPLSKKQVSHAPYGASTCMSIKATLDSATVTLTIHGASIKGTLPHPR
ncbi:hypothetical protein BJV82DRAFT_653987 [Fennellomyces sp. T-0311]|nr:hypothetical protein BJV82DRAFT_653987 [Fennellomyces sp. T-0311]